ncbi:MAG TPA: ATP synthase subunit C [Anaerolineae bacterium]|nr:ATP synthase subunit C [Anaerolineae bacterium]
MILIIALLAGLMPLMPAFVYALRRRWRAPAQATRRMVLGLGSFNLALALMMVGLGLVWLFAPGAVQAAGLAQQASSDPYASLAAALAVSVGSLSAAYAVSTTGSAAVGAIAEKPEVFGRALIFVGLAEGVAIYGLIIAFMIVGR